MSRWGRLLGMAVLLSTTPALASQVVRRALIIAHNGSDDPALPPLRFADDDGVLWAETLQRLGVETTLLVDADEDTRKLDRPVLARARSPTLEAVAREVARLRAAHLADRESGRETDIFVIYVGHGNTDAAGRAYFTLAGGRLDRSTFYAQVVDVLEADYIHIVVDACRASGVVGYRGQNEEVLAELRRVLARETLSERPQVGALFAESDSGETHEWSRIRAGVFSHIVRSGLIGGADINVDGVVEYSELGAFIAASLRGVKGLPVRLTVHTYAPIRDLRRPLVGPYPKGPTLILSEDFEHERISVEDTEGFRLVDVRRTEGQRVILHLPARKEYWVRSPTGEALLKPSQLGDEEIQLEPREVQERGPAEEALQHGLFAVPLDRPFYDQYVAATGLVSVDFLAPSALMTVPPRVKRKGWELGMAMTQAPLVGTLALGPSVAWRSSPQPYYYGLRAAYALTLSAREGVRVHRGTLQAVWGVRARGNIDPFVEAAAGWALVGVSYLGGTQGDPWALAGQTAMGLVMHSPVGHLRVAGLLGVDRISVAGRGRWDLFYGLELGFSR